MAAAPHQSSGVGSVYPKSSSAPSGGMDYGDGGTYDDVFMGQDFIQPPPSNPYLEPTESMGQRDLAEEEFPGMTQVVVEQPLMSESGEVKKSSTRLWDVEYYSFLFDVDTSEVLARLTRSVVPFSVNFLSSIQDNPDMYGPFWLVTTLVFLNAASGNLALWLHDKDDFHYDFEEVTFGAGAFYGYVTIMPVILWIAFKCFDTPITLLQTMCLYGYSMFIYLPTAVLCIIPLEFLRWIIIFVACGWSLLFLLMNLYPPLLKDKADDKKAFTCGSIVLAIVAVCHIGLALTIKFYFFHYSH